jgi:hypothetical protein
MQKDSLETIDIQTRMTQNGTEWNILAAELMAYGYGQGFIAREMNISRTTLYRWRQTAEFKEHYRKTLASLRDSFAEQRQDIFQSALESLQNGVVSETDPPHKRVDTAIKVLNFLSGMPVVIPSGAGAKA